MNIFYKKILLIAMPLFIGILVASCKKDDDRFVFPAPGLIEVTPGEALIGTSVTLKGEKLSDVVQAKVGNLDVDFNIVSDSEMTLSIPEGLEEGETTVTVFYSAASENNLGASDQVGFTVLYLPVISSSTPAEAKPGFDIVLSGNYLKRTSKVTFGDMEAIFEATENDITTTVPVDAITGDTQISVTTPGGTTTIPFKILERTPEIYSFTPSGGRNGEEITITGLFFMDVTSVKIGTTEVPGFEVVNSNEIKFNIPSGVSSDKVTVTTALGSVTSAESLAVIEVPFNLFTDGLHVQMQNWSWGGTDDFASTAVFKNGTMSYMRTYNDAWSGIQLHHGTLDLSPYTKVKFSIYGGPGTSTKVLNFTFNWGAMVPIAVTEGQWTDYTISLSDIGNPATLDNLIFQDNGDTAPAVPFTVYLDDIILIE